MHLRHLALLPICASLLLVGCGGDEAAAKGNSGDRAASSSAAELSTDDQHKLFQAASATGDNATLQEAYRRLGFMNKDGSVDAEKTQKFAADHGPWAQKNVEFLQKISTPEEARKYWNANK